MNGLVSAPNFRDFGGAPTLDGGVVQKGLLFRSEALRAPAHEDVALLADANIALVCDLRSDDEREHAPNDWWTSRGISPLALDIIAEMRPEDGPWAVLGADPSATGAITAMQSLYAAMPAAAANSLRAIVERIAAGTLPLLIHCTAGKDRTGFISAMILAMIGVGRAAIFKDYLASSGRRTQAATEATRALIEARGGGLATPEMIDILMGVDGAYLDRSFSTIRDQYGDLSGYLTFANIHRDLIDRARERLIIRDGTTPGP